MLGKQPSQSCGNNMIYLSYTLPLKQDPVWGKAGLTLWGFMFYIYPALQT